MLGYDTFANKLAALTVSGTVSAAAGAAFALLFGYVGANFAGVQYSILPLLWVLLGGAATTLGPLLGTLVMYVVTDTASSFTSAWLLTDSVSVLNAATGTFSSAMPVPACSSTFTPEASSVRARRRSRSMLEGALMCTRSMPGGRATFWRRWNPHPARMSVAIDSSEALNIRLMDLIPRRC